MKIKGVKKKKAQRGHGAHRDHSNPKIHARYLPNRSSTHLSWSALPGALPAIPRNFLQRKPAQKALVVNTNTTCLTATQQQTSARPRINHTQSLTVELKTCAVVVADQGQYRRRRAH